MDSEQQSKRVLLFNDAVYGNEDCQRRQDLSPISPVDYSVRQNGLYKSFISPPRYVGLFIVPKVSMRCLWIYVMRCDVMIRY